MSSVKRTINQFETNHKRKVELDNFKKRLSKHERIILIMDMLIDMDNEIFFKEEPEKKRKNDDL